ncbi:MFS transporter [Bradyrhizobium sp. 33ap4]|uniref:MFS transporter n=1 Tax=Bradyrhizobium sp. 33ap4 TaxID=3061630 RepID=UPI00397733A1
MVEVKYRVAQDNTRAFLNIMQDLRLYRQRNGANGWSIAHNIADSELWDRAPPLSDVARLSAPAQSLDQSERALDGQAAAFHIDPKPVRIRRMLERQLGSVCWDKVAPARTATQVLSGDCKRC